MIAFESKDVRRVVGRLEPGEHLRSALHRLAVAHRISTGWVRAVGALAAVELALYDASRRAYGPPRRLDSPCELLSLEGNLSTRGGEPYAVLHALVARETAAGLELIGGQVVSAEVWHCELVIECFDDLGLRREDEATTGLPVWVGMSRSTGSAPPASGPTSAVTSGGSGEAPTSTSWAHVAAASEAAEAAPRPRRPSPAARRERPARPEAPAGPEGFSRLPLPPRRRTSEEEFFEEPIPQRGDWVDHKQFGLCRVDGEDPEGNVIIRMPSGRRKTIKLEYLQVLEPRIDGDRVIYPLKPRKR